MKKLKKLFESLGYADVVTYLNSGNVLFESDTEQDTLQKEIPKNWTNLCIKEFLEALWI